MKTNNYIIRKETSNDYFAVENMVRESFWNVYRPGCVEHYVLHLLREDEDFVSELDFVLEIDDELAGQMVFLRTVLSLDNGNRLPIMTMGPICIAPKFKRMGYGKLLLDYGLEKAAATGCGGVCFEGNIDFYGKSGFVVASSKGIRYHGLPEGEDDSFFLCKELKPDYFAGISGIYATPAGYFAAEGNSEAFEEYDKQFPKKEKLVLPGQLF